MEPDVNIPRKLSWHTQAKSQLPGLVYVCPHVGFGPRNHPSCFPKECWVLHLSAQPLAALQLRIPSGTHFPLPGLCSATGLFFNTQPLLSASKSLDQFSLFWLREDSSLQSHDRMLSNSQVKILEKLRYLSTNMHITKKVNLILKPISIWCLVAEAPLCFNLWNVYLLTAYYMQEILLDTVEREI